MNLFRAYAFAYPAHQGEEIPEVPVFFEAPSEAAAAAVLTKLLCLVWRRQPQDVEVYNIEPEGSLREMYREDDVQPNDLALLGNGYSNGRVTYCNPARVLRYVSPRNDERLQALLALLASESMLEA